MELYLQFGYGMQAHCEHLIQQWHGGTVILSPRDIKPDKISGVARKLHRLNAHVLFDPQFYLPRADHPCLQSYAYWNASYQTAAFWSGTGCSDQLIKLFELNQALQSTAVILPGMCTDTIDEIWVRNQLQTIRAAQTLEDDPDKIIATVALRSEVIRNEDSVHEVIEATKEWTIGTIYLICEPPNAQYLVDNPLWLANVVDLIAGLRINGKKVILGYSSHQLLIAGCASATAIASGNHLNVRRFTPSKFQQAEEYEGGGPKPNWYYCPQALSEYRIPTLDLAFQRGMLEKLTPATELLNDEARILFSGSRPTSTGFAQRESFRHYLQTLKFQAEQARRATFDESVKWYENLLNNAERLLDELYDVGIQDKDRSFRNIIDTNRGALRYLIDYRGVMLRRYWSNLG